LTYAKGSRQLKIYLHINMENVYYNGNGIYFSQAFVTDDAVAHEWAHGYCDFSSDLIYRDESGALNEANSDQLGEALDILNSASSLTAIGDDDLIRMDSPRDSTTQECGIDDWLYQRPGYGGLGPGGDTSRWWTMGEEIAPSIGAIRDMYYPECFGHPSGLDSSKFYCGSDDNGGVHWNSGVGNRLFAVMVQGGVRNGVTLPALGMTKALSLAWNTQNAIGAFTTFIQYATELDFQCTSAIGSFFLMPDFNTGISTPDTSSVTETDCDNLALIIEASKMMYQMNGAVGMNDRDDSGHTPSYFACRRCTADVILRVIRQGAILTAADLLSLRDRSTVTEEQARTVEAAYKRENNWTRRAAYAIFLSSIRDMVEVEHGPGPSAPANSGGGIGRRTRAATQARLMRAVDKVLCRTNRQRLIGSFL
jgi:hypothetical protein